MIPRVSGSHFFAHDFQCIQWPTQGVGRASQTTPSLAPSPSLFCPVSGLRFEQAVPSLIVFWRASRRDWLDGIWLWGALKVGCHSALRAMPQRVLALADCAILAHLRFALSLLSPSIHLLAFPRLPLFSFIQSLPFRRLACNSISSHLSGFSLHIPRHPLSFVLCRPSPFSPSTRSTSRSTLSSRSLQLDILATKGLSNSKNHVQTCPGAIKTRF